MAVTWEVFWSRFCEFFRAPIDQVGQWLGAIGQYRIPVLAATVAVIIMLILVNLAWKYPCVRKWLVVAIVMLFILCAGVIYALADGNAYFTACAAIVVFVLLVIQYMITNAWTD